MVNRKNKPISHDSMGECKLSEYMESLLPYQKLKDYNLSRVVPGTCLNSTWREILALLVQEGQSFIVLIPDFHFLRYHPNVSTYLKFARGFSQYTKIIFFIHDSSTEAAIILSIIQRKKMLCITLHLYKTITAREVDTEEESTVKLVYLPVLPDRYLIWMADKIEILSGRGPTSLMVHVASERDASILAGLIAKKAIPKMNVLLYNKCDTDTKLSESTKENYCAIVYNDMQTWLFQMKFDTVIDWCFQEYYNNGISLRLSREAALRRALQGKIMYCMYPRSIHEGDADPSADITKAKGTQARSICPNSGLDDSVCLANKQFHWYILAKIYYGEQHLDINGEAAQRLIRLKLIRVYKESDEKTACYLTVRGCIVYKTGCDIDLATFLVNCVEAGCVDEAFKMTKRLFPATTHDPRLRERILEGTICFLGRDKDSRQKKSWVEVLVNTFYYNIAQKENKHYRMIFTSKKLKCVSITEYVVSTSVRQGEILAFVPIDRRIVQQVLKDASVLDIQSDESVLSKESTDTWSSRREEKSKMIRAKIFKSGLQLCDIFERI